MTDEIVRQELSGMFRKAAALLFIINISFAASALDKDAAAAGRKTAVRFLKLAEEYLAEKDWSGAYSNAEMGIRYDENVSDLWYAEAAALSGQQKSRAEILPLVTKSLDLGQWVDYNRDGARILYADLLSDTGKYDEAVGVIDAKPFIYSADAEYIRVKSYYRMHTAEGAEKARTKVNGARRIYPDDMRFPRLFFRYEYAMKSGDVSDEVQAIADSFIARMPEYDNPDAELEIYAALFAKGPRQIRMLQAFTAHGMKHPLYAGAALRAGVLTQKQALDYFCAFADKNVTQSMLYEFIPLITEDDVKKELDAHLNAYEGVFTEDTDGDLEPNLTVKYSRGRPQTLTLDSNNDGSDEWTVSCDFGVPSEADFASDGVRLFYGTYPSVVKAVYAGRDSDKGAVTFMIPDETFRWSPFTLAVPELLKGRDDCEFFVPALPDSLPPLDPSKILASSSGYEIPTNERDGAYIRFSVLDGNPQTAEYFQKEKMYARAVFENGFPVMRSVDNDGDGVFETTETFGYDPENKMHRTPEEQNQVMTNLFGLPAISGVYVKMIQIDEDGDTVPDFTEEYLADGGRITSWDTDADGSWDVQYKKYPQKKGEELYEDSSFYVMPEHRLVTVTSAGGVPVKVVSGNLGYTVEPGAQEGVYWIGQKGWPGDEKKVLELINQSSSQGVSIITENNGRRMCAVLVGGKIYIETVPETENTSDDEVK